MQNQSANIYKFLSVLMDFVLIVGLYVAVGFWRFEDLRISNPEYYNYYLQLWVLVLASWLAVGNISGIYSYRSGLEQRNVTAQVLRAAVGQFAFLAIVVVGLKGYYYSRVFIAVFFSSFYLLAWLGRMLLVLYLRAQMAAGKWQRPVVMVGAHSTARSMIELIHGRPELGWRCVAEVENAHGLDQVQGDFDELICAHDPSSSAYEEVQNWAEEHGKRFRYLPNMGEHYAGQMSMQTLEGLPVFAKREEPLAGWSNALFKRVFDLVFSAVGIVGILLWLLPILILVQFLSGEFRPFFLQKRVGHGGHEFTVLKLRTMRSGTEQSNAVQRWMRKLGLDELPQFFNVFIGQMSLVGPRPHTAGDDENYGALVQSYRIRHWAKPGMTGLAQIRGLRGGGASASKDLLVERIKADVYYIENWSPILDLRIVAETIVRTVFYPSSLHRKID